MPDITMCQGIGCPMRASCHRFTATADIYGQSYFVAPPYERASGACERFWTNQETMYIKYDVYANQLYLSPESWECEEVGLYDLGVL